MHSGLTIDASTLAPRPSSSRTHSTCPCQLAQWSAVMPSICTAQSTATERHCAAQHCNNQPCHACQQHLHTTATLPKTQPLAFAQPSSNTNIHMRTPHTAQSPRHTMHAYKQPATHFSNIHARAPVQQQPHTLHVSFQTGTMKCRHAVVLYSTINRNRPMPLRHYAEQLQPAHRAKPRPHDACVQSASYSRSRHPRRRPGPAAAAHTRRVLPR